MEDDTSASSRGKGEGDEGSEVTFQGILAQIKGLQERLRKDYCVRYS